jgi:hypothetical protein
MKSCDGSPFFNAGHARWVVCVLKMAIAVVGRESLLGTLLRQTRSEVLSLIKDDDVNEKIRARAACYENN